MENEITNLALSLCKSLPFAGHQLSFVLEFHMLQIATVQPLLEELGVCSDNSLGLPFVFDLGIPVSDL